MQKASLKAAFMRATLKYGAWCFWNAAYARSNAAGSETGQSASL